MAISGVSGLSGGNSVNSTGAIPTPTIHQFGIQGIATLLGTTMSQLQQSLASGQTFGQLLRANGNTLQQGVHAYLSGVENGLNGAVSAGTISQQQATSILAGVARRAHRHFELAQTQGQNQGITPVPPTSTSLSGTGTGSILNASA